MAGKPASRWKGRLAGVLVLLAVAVGGAWYFRTSVGRLFPIHHTGKVLRIAPYHRPGVDPNLDASARYRNFALYFTDGLVCEGYDTALAGVREGDELEIKAYHYVAGWPVLDPEWGECREAVVIKLLTQAAGGG